MNYFRIICVSLVGLALAGCNMLQSKEEQCLQSARLDMKDPDSLKVVQNLGDRGQESMRSVGGFWLRYSANNSYGARISSNMACMRQEGNWVRSDSLEQVAILRLQMEHDSEQMKTALKLAKLTNKLRACKAKTDCEAAFAEAAIVDRNTTQETRKDGDKSAKTVVFEETGPL